METAVPTEVTTELTQILSNLVLGDNEIRSNAEKAVNERLAQTPELYLLALAQFATSADTEVMRSFSLVLLRRLLFRVPPERTVPLYDHLSPRTLTTIERLLLHALSSETSATVRKRAVDAASDLANNSMGRGRPWHGLQQQAFAMVTADDAGIREAAFRVFAGSPGIILDMRTEDVLNVLQRGLGDPQSLEVRHAALDASASYLTALAPSPPPSLAQASPLMIPMLNALPLPPSSHLPPFLNTLTPLASTVPNVFGPHLRELLTFVGPLLKGRKDGDDEDVGVTPTVGNPGAFIFPPPASLLKGKGIDRSRGGDRDEMEEDTRKAALELMISLAEARPSMVKRVDGWIPQLVSACLEGMSELDDGDTQVWLEADPSADPTDEDYPHVYEQSLDRLALALGGKSVLPPAFTLIPGMLANPDWRVRHAGLMAIASVAEGGARVMKDGVGKVVELVLPMFSDPHPRVRYAACQCVGQLCTDLEEIIQEKYHQQIFNVLIPTLEATEPRVHSHAAAALINFCEGVERDTLLPYLDPIVERLLKLLNPGNGPGQPPRRYVQEQAITTLAMVADASEATFAKHYTSIMPLLMNVLQNANMPEYRKLRLKAMECGGLIAIAVGRDVFRSDSTAFIELLMRIQNSPLDPADTMLGHYLISTWAKVCQALGPEFEPYLPVVMPPLLAAASIKADVSIYDEDEPPEEKEGWETLDMDGQQVGIRTSAIEEKCQAFETLLIYCSTLGSRFAPYLAQSLELVLPALGFFFHDGVREAAAMLVPVLLASGKSSNTLTQRMVTATFTQLVSCLGSETDISFLASLYKCFADTLRVTGGPGSLPADVQEGALEATKRQLQNLADRRKARRERPLSELEDDKEDLMLMEEMEEFALEDMAKSVGALDPDSSLLVAVSSVKELALHLDQWDNGDDGENSG